MTSAFYNKVIDILSDENVENKEAVVQTLSDNLLYYSGVIFKDVDYKVPWYVCMDV